MTVGDLDAVSAVEAAAFPYTAWSRAAFAAELRQVPGSRWYAVAHAAGTPGLVLGHVGLLVPDSRPAAADPAAAASADVTTLAVHPEHRRRGVGRALLAAALAEASRRGADRVLLEVAQTNDAALALYAAAGFAELGSRAGYYAGPAGPATVAALVLGKALPAPSGGPPPR